MQGTNQFAYSCALFYAREVPGVELYGVITSLPKCPVDRAPNANYIEGPTEFSCKTTIWGEEGMDGSEDGNPVRRLSQDPMQSSIGEDTIKAIYLSRPL